MTKNNATENSTTPRVVELVNINEAARFLAVSPSTLYGWV